MFVSCCIYPDVALGIQSLNSLSLQTGAFIHFDPREHGTDPEVHIYPYFHFEER